MFNKPIMLIPAAVLLIGAVVLSLPAYEDPAPVPTPTVTVPQDKIVTTATSTKALCTKLDYLGNRDNPSSAVLTCQDGDEITIPGPFTKGMSIGEQIALQDGGTAPGDDGIVRIKSKQGTHTVYFYNMTDEGSLRVYYDEKLLQPTNGGMATVSKIVERNFSDDEVATSSVWD